MAKDADDVPEAQAAVLKNKNQQQQQQQPETDEAPKLRRVRLQQQRQQARQENETPEELIARWNHDANVVQGRQQQQCHQLHVQDQLNELEQRQ